LRIIFDNPAAGTIGPAEYEKAVQLTASLAWHFWQEGAQLSFVAPEHESDSIYEFLRYLALVQPAAALAADFGAAAEEEMFHLIVTGRARGSIPTAMWANSYVIFAGKQVAG
jgi:hypothetical protein